MNEQHPQNGRSALFIVTHAGNGHVIRSGALRDELTSRGWETKTLAVGSAVVPPLPDLVVLDIGRTAAAGAWFQDERRIIVQDEPDLGACDLLVNGSAGTPSDAYRGRRALVGPKFALLRATFRHASAWRAKNWPKRSGVVDLRNMAGLNAEEAANLMAGAQVAITYGGMRCLEAACVATPTVIVPQDGETEGQRRNRDALVSANAAVTAGETNALKVANNLLRGDPAWLKEMGESACEMVDGLGVERVADAIGELFR